MEFVRGHNFWSGLHFCGKYSAFLYPECVVNVIPTSASFDFGYQIRLLSMCIFLIRLSIEYVYQVRLLSTFIKYACWVRLYACRVGLSSTPVEYVKYALRAQNKNRQKTGTKSHGFYPITVSKCPRTLWIAGHYGTVDIIECFYRPAMSADNFWTFGHYGTQQ